MGRVVRLGAVSREETPTAAMRSLILSAVLVGFATPAFAQAVCGGHYIIYIGGAPTATPRFRQHGPPTLPEPSGMTAQDRVLWDALIFDAYEHPTPSPDAEDYWRSSIPLEERHTRVMDTGDATSFGLCIQKADESYTGQRLEPYDSAWWRGEVQRFTNGRWTGTIEVGTCTGDPPAGWVYVREGDPGEVDDDSIAHTVSWFSTNTHGTVETWVKSEIVFHSEQKVRNTSEAYFKVTLAHELGHVLGLSHVPPSSRFVMAPGTLSTWPDQESRLAQLAHQIGAGFEYPGFGPANTPATGAPTITGTARVDETLGETLTAVTTGILDADGLASPTYTYQWIRVDGTDADIAGATSSTYTLVAADLGTTLKVKVTFDDDNSNAETRTSAATGPVAAAANTPATGAPTITGTARVGETLTAVTTGILDADGLASVSYTYQWIRVDGTDADIAGATSSTYTLVAADLGTTLKVKVTFDDDNSNAETRTSAATGPVAAAANTPATGAPTITGTARGGRDADGGHHRHPGRRRAGQRQLHLPVDPGGRHGCRHCGRDVEHLHAGRRRLGHDAQGQGDLRRRQQQCRDAHQRGHGAGGGRRQHPRDGGADDHGHGASGRDADGGHHRHPGRRRAGQRQLHLPVDPGGRHGCRHCGRDVEHLHAGRRRLGHDAQGQGDLRRRQQQCRDAHQRGHGAGGGRRQHPRDGGADDHGDGAEWARR